MRPLPGPLLIVTDRTLASRPIVDTVCATVAGGARWIWFRDRDLPPSERQDIAFKLKAAVADRAALSIGGDPELALRVGAGGVHLPADGEVEKARALLGKGPLIGVSAHTVTDVERARDAGADYVTLSPVFATASKPGYGPAIGYDGLSRAAAFGLPILALGGVTRLNAGRCIATGAAGVAVMGGIFGAANPGAATLEYLAALE